MLLKGWLTCPTHEEVSSVYMNLSRSGRINYSFSFRVPLGPILQIQIALLY